MSDFFPNITSSVADDNLKRLLSLRAFNISGQIIAILVAIYYLDITLPVKPLAIVLICLILLSVFTLSLLKKPENITDNLFFFQLAVDVVSLTAILYFTGGATNPFAWFLLVPHSIASTLLSRRYVWFMAALTSLSYTVIVFFYQPLVHLDHLMEMGMGGHFAEHVMGMWIGFVLSTILMAHFVAGMAESLRKRNALLFEMKERILRDERLVALGAMATSAAHELGTPLGTMDVLAHELEAELRGSNAPSVSDKLSIIQGQIKRCKKVLLSITQTATSDRHDSGQVLRVDSYIANVINRWKVSNLNVSLNQAQKGIEPVPNIISDVELTRALCNVLDNAAYASANYVSIELDWDASSLSVVIDDEGDGMSETQLAKLGTQEGSSKENGLGIGLYLAKEIIQRMGGSIQWRNREKKGVRVSINIPLFV
ncbi:MAG: ATP-binding protein [Cycloclasticus sp.]|nr:MAG: ATP-binding protein [Cycloclasticus sp.]